MITPYLANRSLVTDLFDEMDRFLDDWNRVTPSSRVYDERSFNPACEIAESGEHYLMSVDLPGMKKEDIKIEMSDNMLTVSGERKRESGDKENKWQRYEKSYGFFKRSFNLPSSVDASKVEARYENGVLELYLPKAEAAKPRHIEIQTGKGSIWDKFLGTKKSTQELKDVTSNNSNTRVS
jgi:HSP20 family protein